MKASPSTAVEAAAKMSTWEDELAYPATARDSLRKRCARVLNRRVAAPVMVQLQQGVTPEKLALTAALGLVLGCCPILGSATVLCGLAAVVLRLNQPVIQLVNYAAGPLQLALLIPHYRAGEWLFQTPPVPLSIPLLFERFSADTASFFRDYGLLALQGVAVWSLLAAVAAPVIYFLVRPPLRVLARGLARLP